MKNLFLLFFCIMLLAVMGQTKKEKLERIHVENSSSISFNGSLFIPKTINNVNANVAILSVAGKKYRYVKRLNSLYLDGASKEVPVRKGDVISSTVPVSLFIAREIVNEI